MKLKGLVTSVNEEFLTFELDKRTTVHLTLLFLSKIVRKLPIIGSEIEIKSTHYYSTDLNIKCVVLCDKSEIQGDFSIPLKKVNAYLKVVKQLNLGPSDLLEIDKNLRFLKRSFHPKHDISSVDIIKEIIRVLPKNPISNCDACSKKLLPTFDLEVVSDIRFVDTCGDCYKNYSYWTYGHHWNWNNKYAFGYLYTDSQSGSLYLTDFKTDLLCVIQNSEKCDISKLVNSYVLITDYSVFTEIYNSRQCYVFQYLLIDCHKITVLHFDKVSVKSQLFQEQFSSSVAKTNSFDCKIISKSVPSINSKNVIEFWLQVSAGDKEFFLCLTSKHHIEMYAFLMEGCDYRISYKSSIAKTHNKEIKSINSTFPQFELPSDTILVPLKNNNNEEDCGKQLADVNAAGQLLSSSKFITFQGVMCQKRFVDPLSSRTSKVQDNSKFGSPGAKTHVLEFKTDEGRTVTVFLNNWENLLTPYCLVPQMTVIVKNVIAQKGKYYKSTALTSFEVVEYVPKIKFDTANLYFNEDWGQPFLLGAGSLVPPGVILWSKLTSVMVLGAKIQHKCNQCYKIVNLKCVCGFCGNSRNEISAAITLIVCDQLGESKVIAKDKTALSLLQLLFDAQKPVFEKWCKAFDFINTYEYCKNKTQLDENEVGFEFKKALTNHFEIIDQFGLRLDLKCKKFSEEKENSLYFLLDARRAL